jgi:membrane fusion protein (multidrug efflux system)
MSTRVRVIVAVVVVALVATGGWLWATAGQESTYDAQVDAHLTPIAARVAGAVQQVPVADNQQVDAGDVLVALDPHDFEIAVEKARAELADAEAAAIAAGAGVPITATTANSELADARGGVEQAQAGVDEASRGIEAAQARLASAQARQRESEANAAKTARDVERFKGLLEKDEIPQQQFDAAVAAAEAARASADAAKSQVSEAAAGIRVAESRLLQSRVGEQQARAGLQRAQTAPEQVTATKARAASAEARVRQARAALAQAERNLHYAVVTAPIRGIVSRRSVQVGQVVQVGQPLLVVIPLDDVWITANFKETQIDGMRPGQPVTIKVDAYGGREFKGHVDSVAAATGSRFSLLPPDNATGNYVKVVQRVPVKIVLDGDQDPERLLRPGMSVVPTVHTREAS